MKIEKWDEINGSGDSRERMEAFLTDKNDTYAILQLKMTEETVSERFTSLDRLRELGKEPDLSHYEVVYVAPLFPYKDRNTMLEEIYERFNLDHPEHYQGHSLSVSDIVALRENGAVTCHYVDRIGFQELPGLIQPENYLKNAEMALEDDYGMIDGVINNGKADRVKDGEEQRPSVLQQLKEKHPEKEAERTVRKSAERSRE